MAAIEKQQGHAAEQSSELHSKIKSLLLETSFKDRIIEGKVLLGGSSSSKADFLIDDLSVSQKTPTGKNTQVWLPSKATIFSHVPGLIGAKSELLQFLGSPEIPRKKMKEISTSRKLLESINEVTKDGSLLKKMFRQVRDEKPVDIISWVLKSRGGRGITLVDAQKYVDYIMQHGKWIESPNGTVLWLVDTNPLNTTFNKKGNPEYRKFAHLQRKGSPGSDKHKDGQYYAPMFHVHSNWPDVSVVAEDPTFNIGGI